MPLKPFDKKKSYSLLVGVGRRDQDSEAMAVSSADALYLKEALGEFTLMAEENIDTLVNEKATVTGILDKLDALKEKTKQEPADLVVIYFSGHGYEEDDTYYLVCRDTDDDDIENTAIEGSVWVEKLKAIQCDKMLVLLDCCHSEGMTDVPFKGATFLELKNRVILTACHKSQLSYLSRPVSLFTYALIEGLGGKFLNKGDKEVSVLNLSMDVRERVVALAHTMEKIQQPQLNVLEKSGTTDFVLSRYPKGGPQEVTLLKQKLATLKSEDGKKDLNTNVKSEADPDYRKDFKWMLNVNALNISDSTIDQSVIVQTGPGSRVKVIQNNLQDNRELIQEKLRKQKDKAEEQIWEAARTWVNTVPGSNEEKALENDIRALNLTLDQLIKEIST